MKKFLSLLLALFVLVGCSSPTTSRTEVSFQQFLKQAFIEDMEASYVNMHDTLKDPDKYGIKVKEISFGKLFEDNMKTKQRLKELEKYEDKVKGKEKTYYQIYYRYLCDQINIDESKYDYLYNICAPSNSVTSTITTALTEFRFDDEQDIKDYITLIKSVPTTCKEIISYLKKQKEKGYFMGNHAADNYISNINQFLNKDSIPLTSVFKNYPFTFSLSDSKKADYLSDIEEAYLDCIYPSFTKVKETVQSLKSSKNNQKGLCFLKNGKDYYEQSMISILGMNTTVSKVESELKSYMNKHLQNFLSIARQHPSSYNNMESASTGFSSYKAMLQTLNTRIKQDFPEIPEVSYKASAMPAANAQDSTAAYYMTPVLDSNMSNTIRVNEGKGIAKNSVSTFMSIAHEGFPGHMYQFNYMKNLKQPEILYTSRYLGFVEGYATYAQFYATKYLSMNQNTLSLILENEKITNALMVLCDIGIHYKGWNQQQLKSFTSNVGFEFDDNQIETIYYQLLDTPHIFTPYYVGYMKIEALQTKAKRALGNKYSDKDFHRVLNENGIVALDILEQQVNNYIKNK